MVEATEKTIVPTEPENVPSAEIPATESTVKAVDPLATLTADLESIITNAGHNEMWGVILTRGEIPTSIVLEKFLRANDRDVEKAKSQLVQALKWRKEIQPAKLLADVEFDNSKFGGLGYVTVYPKTEAHGKEIVSWNIYGAVKNMKNTFGDVDEFIRWRAALMECSVQQLDLKSATTAIPVDGEDPYKMIQVHDYLSVSFLRQDAAVKAATKKTIEVFAMAYPELLKEKFFVNVPLLMGWVFTVVKLFVDPKTVKKFHPLSYGANLAGEVGGLGAELPVVYGGKGRDIKDGLTVRYAGSSASAAEGVVPAAAPAAGAVKEA